MKEENKTNNAVGSPETLEQNQNQDLSTNSETLNNLEVRANPSREFLFFMLDLIKTGIIVFVIAFCLRYFVIQPFIVDGESMMPNYLNNEYLLAEKVSYLLGQPHRGDVVVFRYPENPSVSYIKRVIALPGERVLIKDNKVTIFNSDNSSGFVLDESDYLATGTMTLPNSNKDYLEKTIGDNEFFVMGDNRQHSSDSREWGVLPKSNIIGRSWLTLLPTNKFGINKRLSIVNFYSAFALDR